MEIEFIISALFIQILYILFFHPSTCTSSYPSIHLLIHPTIYSCLPIYSCIHPSTHPSNILSIHPSFHISIHLLIQPSFGLTPIYQYICWSICLLNSSIYPSITHFTLYPFIHYSTHWLCSYMFIYNLSIYPFIHLFIHSSTSHLSILPPIFEGPTYWSMHLFLHPIHPSISLAIQPLSSMYLSSHPCNQMAGIFSHHS